MQDTEAPIHAWRILTEGLPDKSRTTAGDRLSDPVSGRSGRERHE